MGAVARCLLRCGPVAITIRRGCDSFGPLPLRVRIPTPDPTAAVRNGKMRAPATGGGREMSVPGTAKRERNRNRAGGRPAQRQDAGTGKRVGGGKSPYPEPPSASGTATGPEAAPRNGRTRTTATGGGREISVPGTAKRELSRGGRILLNLGR
ncbi:hypothetical protein GCM10009753_16590 [Streptantibioticus ferralitis]